MTLADLVSRLPNGLDRDVARLVPMLKRLSRMVARVPVLAEEDVLQELLLKLVQEHKRSTASTSRSTFLGSVARNRAMELIRFNKRRLAQSKEFDEATSEPGSSNPETDFLVQEFLTFVTSKWPEYAQSRMLRSLDSKSGRQLCSFVHMYGGT